MPYFEPPADKVDEFKKNFPTFYKNTRKGTKGCLFYGFAQSGNKFYCRESYKDAESVLQHLKDVGDVLGKAVEISGPPKLALMGPKAELDKCKEALDPFGTVYWEADDASVWFGTKGGKPGKQDTHVSLHPTFNVPAGKMDEFKKIVEGFYAGTKAGTRECLYFGARFCGDKCFIVEGYRSAKGAIQHATDIGDEIKAAFGIAGTPKQGTPTFLQAMGPAKELEKMKPVFDAFDCEYWELDKGCFWK